MPIRNLNKMTERELKTIITEAQGQLERQDSVKKAGHDLRRLIKKYDLTSLELANLTTELGNLKSGRNRTGKNRVKNPTPNRKSSSNDNRSKVVDKYRSIDGKYLWSGRGRQPQWVNHICEEQGIDITSFKTDIRYTIPIHEPVPDQHQG